MSRYNWLNLATWVVPFVCLILAFYIGFYKWRQYDQAVQHKKDINKQIAEVDSQTALLPPSPIGHLVAADTPMEPYFFLAQLQALLQQSGATLKGVTNKAPTPLPPLGKSNPSGSANPTPTAMPSASSPQPGEFSLLNLPRGTRAISAELTIHGPYDRLRDFLYRLRNYRYTTRAININDVSFFDLDDTGSLTARMTLTRFVRPEPKTAPINAATPGSSGALPPSASSQALSPTGLNPSAPASANVVR
ncbi:MAG TPA: hypothetical protein VFB21_21480 [Chthonomonadaceae bacterium]|jgi:hypothetical protein|nr:hypothetical protein [Chthonomonadaceae bacterium]